MRTTPFDGYNCSEYVLGGAQIGLPYGAVNTVGQPGEGELARMLTAARAGGVTAIDTANAYGRSEQLLGDIVRGGRVIDSSFLIITKLSTLEEIDSMDDEEITRKVKQSVMHSLENLGLTSLSVLLLHKFEHVHYKGGLILKTLLQLQRDGLIGRIGVSVYDPEEALECLQIKTLTVLQLPFNVLDTRHLRAGVFRKSRERGVDVFVRSVFLQGVLAEEPSCRYGYPAGLLDPVGRLNRIAQEGNMTSRMLAMRFARAFDEATGFVVGAETEVQVRDNLAMFNIAPLDRRHAEHLAGEFSDLPESLINASFWK